MRLLFMQQINTYFFGKLNQSRDFIISENLQDNDKNFWDKWFDRCANQNKLIPFTRKAFFASRIWLFCVTLPANITYTGITTLSSDQTGRQYPFVLFQKPCTPSERLKSINYFLQNIDFFNQTLTNGKCVIKDCLDTIHKSTNPLSESFLNFLLKTDNIGSFWMEFESNSHIESNGEPTCSLFNKIFGL